MKEVTRWHHCNHCTTLIGISVSILHRLLERILSVVTSEFQPQHKEMKTLGHVRRTYTAFYSPQSPVHPDGTLTI